MRATEIRHQAGQLLILGFDGTEPTARMRTIIAGIQPGGIILFARNIETPQQTHALLASLTHVVDVPAFTCVDLEGGTVDRLKNILAPAPSVEMVFATGNKWDPLESTCRHASLSIL